MLIVTAAFLGFLIGNLMYPLVRLIPMRNVQYAYLKSLRRQWHKIFRIKLRKKFRWENQIVCHSSLKREYLKQKRKIQSNWCSFITLYTLFSIVIVGHFGFCDKAGAYLALAYGLLLLAYIDIQYYLLPDCVTLPLLWLGLICNSFGVFLSAAQAVWGAVVGYVCLAILAAGFKCCRGEEGIGGGDIKLCSVFGAWWGIYSLATSMMISSLLGIFFTLIQIILKKHRLKEPIAFGPYMIFAGFLVMFFYS